MIEQTKDHSRAIAVIRFEIERLTLNAQRLLSARTTRPGQRLLAAGLQRDAEALSDLLSEFFPL